MLGFILFQEILVDRSVHAATARFLSSDLAVGSQEKPVLFKDDFLRAMHEFVPVAMRDITKPAADGGRSGWEDVGGLNDIRDAIIEVNVYFLLFIIFKFFFLWLYILYW